MTIVVIAPGTFDKGLPFVPGWLSCPKVHFCSSFIRSRLLYKLREGPSIQFSNVFPPSNSRFKMPGGGKKDAKAPAPAAKPAADDTKKDAAAAKPAAAKGDKKGKGKK